MEINAEQLKLITNFVQDWSSHEKYELETTFGQHGVVDATTFLQISQRLRNKGFAVIPQDDRLSIITPNHIRLSLQGLGVLQSYCKDDTLQEKAFTAMFKDRAFPESNVDLKEYDIRFKVRREEELSNDDPRVVALLTNWERQPKAFRLIRRWSFMGNGIRIDMSMVRQSPTDPMKGGFQWVYRFLDSNVFKQLPRYEVEVELLHHTEFTDTEAKALKALIGGVGEVMRGIQGNTLLIRNSVMQSVRNDYQALIGTDRFRGVNPVTLEVKNMTEAMEESIPNIRNGFNVTDKADGLRTMGYVNKDGELFLLDMSMRIYRTGLKNPKCKESLVDGEWVTSTKQDKPMNAFLIFDIYYSPENVNESTKPFVLFKDNIFDATADSRYNAMKKWFGAWNSGEEIIAKGVTSINKLNISLKKFEFAFVRNNSIFQACSLVLDSPKVYRTDGLILTSDSQPIPQKSGVRWDYQFKWKPAKDNTVDFLINYEKNSDLPTLDKVTTTIHPTNATNIQYKTMRLFVGGESSSLAENPRAAILMELPLPTEKNAGSKYQPILFNPMDYPDTMANTCHIEVQNLSGTNEEYCLTEDTQEPILDRSIVEMRYDPSRDPGWRWIPSRIRHDKTERLQRAVAKKGAIKYSGTMNDEKTANSVWNSIHNPITVSMIKTGKEEPLEEEVMAILKTREMEVSKTYYERKAPKENIALISGLQKFHNEYIKNFILLKTTLRGSNKHLLDLSCGKGGDLFKWVFNHARYVVGVDIAGDNITNPENGAYHRYIDALIEFGPQRVPKMAFIIGDSSRRLIDGEAGSTPEESNMLRSIFGKYQPEGPIPKYIQNVMAGSYRSGADVAACMFALHYFFENEEKLKGFLQNLSDTVKIGGFFVGCCFDGDRVFRLLQNVEKGHSKSGKENDVPIWTITKDYEKEELTPDDDSIGLGIDVEFISIGTTHKEYLVPFELLTKKLKEIGFELLESDDLKTFGLRHSTNTFDESYSMAIKGGKKYTMIDSVKQFSFLNRWFIFKRTGEVGMPDVPLEQVNMTRKIVLAEVEEEKKDDADADTDAEAEAEEEKKENAMAAETGARLPGPDRKFSAREVFTFGIDVGVSPSNVSIKNEKGLADKHMARWLSLAAPFPIPDPDTPEITYPTIEHYLAAMKLKYASNKPELAAQLMSSKGSIHQPYLTTRMTDKIRKDSPRDFELLAKEASDVRKKLTKTELNAYRASIDENEWLLVKDKVLMDALRYRWEHDRRFHDIVEASRTAGKYMLYSTSIAAASSELGGKRSIKTEQIDGENKVGRYIMELAGFQF
jgi:mRNA (guanine-N7-)-methyltransferase